MGDKRGVNDGVDKAFNNLGGRVNLIDLALQNSDFAWFSFRNEGV